MFPKTSSDAIPINAHEAMIRPLPARYLFGGKRPPKRVIDAFDDLEPIDQRVASYTVWLLLQRFRFRVLNPEVFRYDIGETVATASQHFLNMAHHLEWREYCHNSNEVFIWMLVRFTRVKIG